MQLLKIIKNRIPLLIVAAVFQLCGGCGGYSPEAHRVDAALAHQTLEIVLSSWVEGATPESWQQKTPQVIVQDMEWKSGKILNSFEILPGAQSIDANLNCQVKLSLNDESGERQHTVTYHVGTSPALTVFRAPGP